jgi:hypothetical protein
MNASVFGLEQRLNPTYLDFDKIVSYHGIPCSDISGLRKWLDENKPKVLEAIERMYKTKDIQSYELGLPFDIPQIRRQAEEFAAVHIQKYHKILGKMLQNLTKVGEFLREIDAVPTTMERSYFNHLTKTLAIGIPAICFTTEDGNLQIREKDMIVLYGHEGMGHALNKVITDKNGLPHFIKRAGGSTAATQESVAQFYQKVIFEDLRNSPDVQEDLGIKHKFNDIYQEAKDNALLEEYSKRLFFYAITVLADKTLGEYNNCDTMKKKIELIRDVSIDSRFPMNFVEGNRNNFDSQGNLNSRTIGELIYCAQPVERALEEFAKQGIMYEGEGRSKMDSVLLNGFWTPIGFVDNARLMAKELRK